MAQTGRVRVARDLAQVEHVPELAALCPEPVVRGPARAVLDLDWVARDLELAALSQESVERDQVGGQSRVRRDAYDR